MENRIKAKICTGTNCFVMGAADLLALEDNLPDDLKDKLEIVPFPCLEYCENHEGLKPPFVEIDGNMLSSVTVSRFIENVRKLLV